MSFLAVTGGHAAEGVGFLQISRVDDSWTRSLRILAIPLKSPGRNHNGLMPYRLSSLRRFGIFWMG